MLLLHHHQTVLLPWPAVRALASVPAATQVSVEPFSSDDWEMVEQNAGHMEEQLCNQVPALESRDNKLFRNVLSRMLPKLL